MNTEVKLINDEIIPKTMGATETKKKKEINIKDLPGVGAATAEKLAAAGYDNLLSIAVASLGELVEASGVSEAVGRKMIQSARAALDMGFESGDEILNRRNRVIKIK